MFYTRKKSLLILFLLSLSLMSCSLDTSSTPTNFPNINEETSANADNVIDEQLLPLVQKSWELQDIRDGDLEIKADSAVPAIIEFREDGTYLVNTGCGQFGGNYAMVNGDLNFTVMMTSAVADCTPALVEQSYAVETFLPQVTGFSLSDDEEMLTLMIAIDRVSTWRNI